MSEADAGSQSFQVAPSGNRARPVRATPPWHFRLAKWLIRRGRFGGYRLVELADRLGWLRVDVRFPLGPGVTLDVPLDRRPNQWDLEELLGYERPLVDAFVAEAQEWAGPVRWVDVGADIGTMTALIASRLERLNEVWAFEPNAVSFEYLARNVGRLPVPATARQLAVSDRSGRGSLVRSASDSSDHAMYLETRDDGELDVARLDDLLPFHPSLLLVKIDVEGGEFAVLRGAERLLREVPAWGLSFEAHRQVCQRTGVDPSECVRWLSGLRPVGAYVVECPGLRVDWRRDLLEQVPADRRIVNVFCRSLAEPLKS